LLHSCDDNYLSEFSDSNINSSCDTNEKSAPVTSLKGTWSEFNHEAIAQTDSSTDKNEDGESGILQPTKDRLLINFGGSDPYSFNVGLGSRIGRPTALLGGTRLRASSTIGQIIPVFPVGGHIEKGFGPNQRALLEIFADVQAVVLDLSYTVAPKSIPGAFSVNAQTTRSFVGAFSEGDDVDLPNGADPWLHRISGGVEYLFPFSSQFNLASALNYQLVSVRPGAFTDNLSSIDENGNQVTVSDDGQDTLLTFNLSALYNGVDNISFPTQGTRVIVGIDTSIPVGDADVSFGRFVGSATQFIPFNIFGFTEGPRTLILNLQAGTFVGDVPPYEGFSMGGSRTIRGYSGGDVGTGSSFLLTSTEYRFPIANDLHILTDFDLQGTLFFDYGTDFNTADQVIGEPANVRDKKGYGFGYGLGLNAVTGFGLVRTEFALNDEGDFTVHFTVGDRF
jgi:outer membrane protein insertion porin family